MAVVTRLVLVVLVAVDAGGVEVDPFVLAKEELPAEEHAEATKHMAISASRDRAKLLRPDRRLGQCSNVPAKNRLPVRLFTASE